jgi:carbon monoxide dehydrogenase subunit G
MEIAQNLTMKVSIEDAWRFLLDFQRVGQCLPGAEDIKPVGPDAYTGTLRIKLGAIAVHLSGQVKILESDESNRIARFQIEANDRRIRGSVRATTTMQLRAIDELHTEMTISTEAAVLGKLGQFGQAVMRKKADQLLAEFARNMSSVLSPNGGVPDAKSANAIRQPAQPATVKGPPTSAPPAELPRAQPLEKLTDAQTSPRRWPGVGIAMVGLGVGIFAASTRNVAWAIFGLSVVVCGVTSYLTSGLKR